MGAGGNGNTKFKSTMTFTPFLQVNSFYDSSKPPGGVELPQNNIIRDSEKTRLNQGVGQSTSQNECFPRESYNNTNVKVYEGVLKDPDEPVKGHGTGSGSGLLDIKGNKRFKPTSSKDTNSANQAMNQSTLKIQEQPMSSLIAPNFYEDVLADATKKGLEDENRNLMPIGGQTGEIPPESMENIADDLDQYVIVGAVSRETLNMEFNSYHSKNAASRFTRTLPKKHPKTAILKQKSQ